MRTIKALPEAVRHSMRSAILLFDMTKVVEELVFNSLDAGATKVSVFVGVHTCYVKVVDNGCGISRDGLILLGERYATSKLYDLADPEAANWSFGFRGEALASISDISLLEIATKDIGRPNGYRKVMKGSKCLYLGIDGDKKDVGTTVVVRDLFYNQPVRRKFMQSSPKKVLHSIKKCVLRIALVHSKVSFQIIDIESDEELLRTSPSSPLSPLSSLMNGSGIENSSSLREVNCDDGILKLSGFVSSPIDSSTLKAVQYVYINSRFVSEGPIHKLIHHLATSAEFPDSCKANDGSHQKGKRSRPQRNLAYFLNLTCPRSLYDFAFEPSKTYVEFKDWTPILIFVEKVIQHLWREDTALGSTAQVADEWDKEEDSLKLTEEGFMGASFPEVRESAKKKCRRKSHLLSSSDEQAQEVNCLFPGEHEKFHYRWFGNETAGSKERTKVAYELDKEGDNLISTEEGFMGADFPDVLKSARKKCRRQSHLVSSPSDEEAQEVDYMLPGEYENIQFLQFGNKTAGSIERKNVNDFPQTDHYFQSRDKESVNNKNILSVIDNSTFLEYSSAGSHLGMGFPEGEYRFASKSAGNALLADFYEIDRESEVTDDIKKPFLHRRTSHRRLEVDRAVNSSEEEFGSHVNFFKTDKKQVCFNESSNILKTDVQSRSFYCSPKTLRQNEASSAQHFCGLDAKDDEHEKNQFLLLGNRITSCKERIDVNIMPQTDHCFQSWDQESVSNKNSLSVIDNSTFLDYSLAGSHLGMVSPEGEYRFASKSAGNALLADFHEIDKESEVTDDVKKPFLHRSTSHRSLKLDRPVNSSEEEFGSQVNFFKTYKKQVYFYESSNILKTDVQSMSFDCSPKTLRQNDASTQHFSGLDAKDDEHEKNQFLQLGNRIARSKERMDVNIMPQTDHCFQSWNQESVSNKNSLSIIDNSTFLEYSSSGSHLGMGSPEGECRFASKSAGNALLADFNGIDRGSEVTNDIKEPFLHACTSRGSFKVDRAAKNSEEEFGLPINFFQTNRKQDCFDGSSNILEIDVKNMSFDCSQSTPRPNETSSAEHLPRLISEGDEPRNSRFLPRSHVDSFTFQEEPFIEKKICCAAWGEDVGHQRSSSVCWDSERFHSKSTVGGSWRRHDGPKDGHKADNGDIDFYASMLKKHNQGNSMSWCTNTFSDVQDNAKSNEGYTGFLHGRKASNDFPLVTFPLLMGGMGQSLKDKHYTVIDKYDSQRVKLRYEDHKEKCLPKERLRRSHSAPPFYRHKKKFISLSQHMTKEEGDTCDVSSSRAPDKSDRALQSSSVSYEHFKPNFVKDAACCLRQEIKNKLDTTSDVNKADRCKSFVCSPHQKEAAEAYTMEDIQHPLNCMTKWRDECRQATNNKSLAMQSEDSILNISSGFLQHLTGSLLVPESITRKCLADAKALQQVDKKFIPVVTGGTLAIIDQHAADERIRLEELRQRVLSGEGKSITYMHAEQELILPEIRYQLLQNYADEIKGWGWICNINAQGSKSFKNNLNIIHGHPTLVTLVAVPCILGVKLSDVDLLEFLQQLADTDGSSTIPAAVLRILNFKACRGAIMFGDSLLPSECSLIVEELKRTSLCFQCAHGRPTMVPLVSMKSLHQKIAKIGTNELWHGLHRQELGFDRALARLIAARGH